MKCEIFKDRLEIERMIEDIILNDTMGFVDYGNIRIIEREGVLRLAFKYSCKKNEPEFIDTIINAIAQISSSKQAIKGCVLILQTKDTQGSIDVNDVSVLWNKIGAILGERVYNTFEFATKESTEAYFKAFEGANLGKYTGEQYLSMISRTLRQLWQQSPIVKHLDMWEVLKRYE